MISLVADLLLDHLEVFLKGIYLFLLQTHDRVLAGEEKQGTDIADVLDDFAEEMDGHHDAQPFHIVGMPVTVHDMPITDNQDVTRLDNLFLGIQLIHHFPFCA